MKNEICLLQMIVDKTLSDGQLEWQHTYNKFYWEKCRVRRSCRWEVKWILTIMCIFNLDVNVQESCEACYVH